VQHPWSVESLKPHPTPFLFSFLRILCPRAGHPAIRL
jgi:hypothetical protein